MDSTFLKDKLEHVFESLQCAAENIMALEFVRRNVEDGKNRYFWAHENNLLSEMSRLFANEEDLLELQKSVDDLIIVELSAQQRFLTKRKFFFATNVTVFAALLKSSPVGCQNVWLQPHLFKRAHMLTV